MDASLNADTIIYMCAKQCNYQVKTASMAKKRFDCIPIFVSWVILQMVGAAERSLIDRHYTNGRWRKLPATDVFKPPFALILPLSLTILFNRHSVLFIHRWPFHLPSVFVGHQCVLFFMWAVIIHVNPRPHSKPSHCCRRAPLCLVFTIFDRVSSFLTLPSASLLYLHPPSSYQWQWCPHRHPRGRTIPIRPLQRPRAVHSLPLPPGPSHDIV